MRRERRLVALGMMVLVASVSATAWASNRPGGSPPVRLRLAHHTLRAGQSVPVKIVNRTSRDLLISSCFLLQLREAHGWKTITRTHGVNIACSLTDSVPFGPHDCSTGLILYDDLRPGMYRITMAYKVLPKHWHKANLRHHYRLMRAEMRVLRFRPGPAPHLTGRQIRRKALKVAAEDGDSRPTLIQHAEGIHFEAALVAGGDLVFDWHWAYLIAMRGHFKLKDFHGPPGAKPPHGTVITLVLDAKTGQGEDFGLSNHYPDIAKLGPVTTDYRR